jgi:hypothetical protein
MRIESISEGCLGYVVRQLIFDGLGQIGVVTEIDYVKFHFRFNQGRLSRFESGVVAGRDAVRMVSAVLRWGVLVVACNQKLAVGSVFVPQRLTGMRGEHLAPQPLYIVRMATISEYEAQSELHRGWPPRRYYYAVTTD